MWLSIIPPPVGLGWKHKIADVGFSSGVATSPISVSPSAVCNVKGVLMAGKTVLGRIGPAGFSLEEWITDTEAV